MVLFQPADLVHHGIDILFPPRCTVCSKKIFAGDEKKICRDCLADIVYLRQPICRACGMELAGDGDRNYLCGSCLGNPPPYLLARSVVRYTQSVQKLLYRLKYGEDTSVLSGIAEILLPFDLVDFVQCDYVVPVPLHYKKLRQRGLNQSILLAKIIFGKEIPPILRTNLLRRIRNTVPQTKLGGAMRRKNLKDAFAMADRADITGRAICLVDDVFTTGTTVSECSTVLLENGAKEVRVITMTRVGQPQCCG